MPLPRARAMTPEQIERNERSSSMQTTCREITLRWSMDAIAAGTRTGLPTTAAWAGLGVSAVTLRPMVRVHNSYAIRDTLKAAGYHFDGIDRVWAREHATIAECVTEAQRLAAAGVQMGDGQAI